MKLNNRFEVPLNAEDTWAELMDIEGVASCVPGAELIEVTEDEAYKGRISVRLGPVSLSIRGTARFEDRNPEAGTALVKAQGADEKGRGGATASVLMALEPGDGVTTVTLDTDVNLSGSIAQYGRASGMIQAVATEITDQFAANLRNRVAARSTPGRQDSGADAAPAPPRDELRGVSLVFRALLRRLSALFSARGR